MAVNPNGPNPNNEVDRFSQTVENLVDNAFGGLGRSLTVRDVLGGSILNRGLEKGVGKDSFGLLSELINKLDRPILKNLALDTITVVSGWFTDPEVLCCLIQGIWAMYAATYSHTDLAKIQKKGIGIADTDFAKWLDVLIAFVDLIITFLSSDLKKISIMIPDFIKEIMNGVVGAILMVLQEVLFALRDSAINAILQEIDRAQDASLDMENIWAKCIPFAQLLTVLKKHVHDYGLFAELFTKIKGFVSGLVGDFGYMKALDFPKNVADIEFLYWFRDLLIKLKQAAINFDLCVLYGDAATSGPIPDETPRRIGQGDVVTATVNNPRITRNNPSEVQGFKVASDGTILQDKRPLIDNSIPILSNSSIRTFLNKYYGIPMNMVDNVLTGSSSAESIQGSDINSANISALNADCPNSPAPEEIVRWALRVRNRNL